METLEKICEHCLAVCQVPIGVSEIYLRSRVESQFQYGRILDTDRVDGIESSRNLTRFVLLCSSAADVDHMCKEVKEEDIQIEDNHFTVKYQKAVSCEFPDRWDDFEILEPDNSQPQSSTDSTREPESHVGPELPPRRPKQQTPPHAWPQGPYGAMSGFYHNIPIHPQGDADHIQGAYDLKMNQDDIRQQMHKFANAQAQPSMQGHEHQQDDPLGLGPQHGPQQMFQCDPGGQGQFQPGFSMFAMPQTSQPDKHNAPREQNMQFRPRMPMPFMVYDPQSRQMIPFPGPGFPGMPPQQAQEGSEPWRLPPQLPSGPPPPYNDEKFRGQGQSFEVKSSIDRPDYEHGLQHGTINEEPEDKKEEPEMLVTDENQTKIVVSNLPSTVHEEYLEMYFENTRKGGGGPVFHVDINEENGTAIVEFENPEAVDIVLNKCPIKMMGQEVEVIVYKPEPPVPRCTIEVTGPCSIVCEEQLETLEMYFESFKRSGGGEVVDCRFDKENNMVLITFENEEVARRVEERVAHVVRKEKLNVALHVPTKLSKKLDKTKEEDEPEPPKTIKVKGVDKSASRDTVEFYFENSRQSGGGDIETIKSYEEDEDVIYITFKNQKDAIKVMERGHHKVDGKELSVSLYVPPTPPPTYENKILIKGLKSDTTYDCLYNFIQAKTGYEPDSMFWHAEQEDVVIITFSDNPDFQELEKIFGKTKLEGASLKVYQVPISSCIIVANLPSGVTKETIEFYFENTRKSGGGQVEKVVMNDDDTCLVYFADYSIIDKVLGRKHVLSKQQLGVKRYQECLGRPEGDICERKLNLPGPVKMKDICPQKQKFLKASKCYQEALEKHMQSCHARVVLPTDGADVTLKCAISEDVENCFTLVKTWKMEAEKCFDHFLNTIVVHQISVLQENWDKAVERLEPITRNVRDNVAVFLEKNDAIVTVVGNKHPVENVARSIYEILLKIAEEAQIVKETFNSLKSLETRLLLVSKFPTTVEELIPEVKVKINQEKNEILFEGSRGNVRDAKLKLYEMKSKYVQRSLENISTLSAGLLKVKQTKQYIVNKFKMQQVTGVWEIQGQTLVIISTSEQTIDQCVSIIRASVMEQCVGLTKSSASVMNSEAWLYKVEEWHSQYAGKAHIAVDDFMTKVEICSTDDIANELLDSVKIFLGSNTVLEENIPCNKHLHKLIEKHHKNEISQICKELQSYHVSIISSEYNGCRICGTEDGIMKSKELLNKLFDKVKLKDRTVAKPDLVQQMKTHSVMDDLSATERSIPHVISLKDEWDKEQKCNILSTINEKRNKIKVKASCKAYANRKVYTAVGDIAEMPVQVLVSAADETINLSEGIGKALVLKGKPKADYIVHVIGPVWRGGENNEEDMLEETVFKCMQQASEKGATSMAIPAISCGAFGYPVKQGTKTIVKAMKNFFHEVQESRISDIYLCDVKCNTVDSFTDALKTEFDNIHIEDESEEKDNEPYVDLSPQSRSDYYSRQQMAEMGSDDVHNDEYYTSSDADKFVNSGRRKVEEKELDVALCNPPVPATSYKNKFLIKGLKPTTTQDCLFNFIEAKTGSIPQTMDHHAEQDGVVMVTFTESPDFQELEKVFEKNRLEGASLKLYTVPISNCITVANLASEVTKHTVVYYFENTEKSGGGQVEEVVMNDDQTCLVYFADFKLIDTILEKKHKLCGKHLNVKRYHDCLGRPEGEIAERMLRIPEDLVLKDVDPKKIKFMKHSNQNRSALEIQLDTFYTKIYWPDETGHVVLTCTLTRKVKDCFRLVKQWKETAEQNFRVFMKNIFVNKVPVLQDIWSKVMEELKTVTIDNPEAVAIFVDKNEGIITLVGNKRVTESLSKKIVFVRKKVMAEIEMEREKIKEVFTSLKLIETKMLLADKFPAEMENLFPDLKVIINQNKNEIVFEGPLGQVRDAKLKMYEMKSRFASASIDKISDLAAGLFLLKQTNDHIVKKLKAYHLTAVWDIIDGGLVVYSTSVEQIQDCLSVIRGSVIENTIALKNASKTLVNSEGWHTKVDELHAHHTGKSYIKVSEDARKVQICATDDISNEIVDSLKKFLRLTTVTEVKVTCTKNVCRLIERHHKSELQNIAKVLQHSHIQIVSVPGYGGFEVHGTEDGIQKARSDLLALLKRVQQREYILSKPGLADHMQTPKGKDNLNTIESTLACVVSVKGDDYDEEILDDPYDTIPAHSEVNENIGIKGLKIIGYCKAYDCRNIYTAEGDMTELTVGMIVNLADDKLSLTGGLGKALVQKGGKEIQRECTEYIKYEGRLDDGDTFVSTAGKLKADFIVHVRGPVWRGGMMKEDEMLAEAVFKCLQQASTRSLTSVAMPAISCGTYGYPVRKATLTIVQAVKNFFREVQESTVTDIYLCDMKLNIVEAFNASLSNEFGGTDFQKYVLKQNERPRPAARKSASYDDEYEDNPYDIRPMDTDEEEDDDYYTSSSVMAPPRGRQPPLLPKGRPIKRSDSGASIGNIDVSVVKGEIARQKVDVIVNTTAKNLDLKNGAVSGSLLKTGGIKLQQEVSGKYPNGIKIGELAITSGQKLKCDVVIHSSMTNWDGSKDTLCKQALQKLVKDCMKEAEKQNKTSIAFPAIGTGNLGFPRDIVASEMLTAVSKFAKRNPVSSVRDVRFIVYQKDFQTIQAFEAEIERWASGKRGGIQRRKFNAYEDLQQGRRKGWWSGKEADDDQSSRPKGKKKPKTQTDPHTVTFIILAVSEDTINQAIKKLESCLEKDVHFKRFDDSIIMKMDDNQVMEIKAIARQFHLEMQLESAKGHIQISGIASNVMSASDKIHRIMRDAVSLEQAKHCAALMSNLVQWSYIETGETGQSLIPYDKDLNYKIETAYISKAPNVKFSSNKTKYVVDFNKMEEYPADDMTDVVTVLRRDLVKQGVFKLPLLWADMTGNLEVVVLPTASQEYQDVSQQCVASAGAGFTVVKVERVQNKTLWAQYQAKKKQLDDQNPPNTTNERLLWHGTAVETVDFINEFGFNRSYCGRNATMYGHGVYFAVSAQYTCRNTYSRPDPSGVKRMYYCRVLTGEFTQGKQGMRVPPNKGGAGSTALYDSVVDGPGSPGMFIIFHDTQAYPEYLVSFKPQ
ncbi:protein mono-ADP-ribosyltransferase PARP14-like isoform X2 [Mercenaria mercenaria]|uniref:protein mono-ADP-ribosyltransferase PARP14-like isoform X2 n=1 Tax=Mercenaria mercenaria TaxID=6596 RepID=UPI00234F5F42|nr:protein mono-ADP-ribosyltransferase PARP14-like isoform X2 [Mercenaria mercenaria]